MFTRGYGDMGFSWVVCFQLSEWRRNMRRCHPPACLARCHHRHQPSATATWPEIQEAAQSPYIPIYPHGLHFCISSFSPTMVKTCNLGLSPTFLLNPGLLGIHDPENHRSSGQVPNGWSTLWQTLGRFTLGKRLDHSGW